MKKYWKQYKSHVIVGLIMAMFGSGFGFVSSTGEKFFKGFFWQSKMAAEKQNERINAKADTVELKKLNKEMSHHVSDSRETFNSINSELAVMNKEIKEQGDLQLQMFTFLQLMHSFEARKEVTEIKVKEKENNDSLISYEEIKRIEPVNISIEDLTLNPSSFCMAVKLDTLKYMKYE